MNMWEALQAFKENVENPAREDGGIGIRPKSWGEQLCKRMLVLTGVDSTNMFGLKYYDFVAEMWYDTWSVFMPTYYEAFAEWEAVEQPPRSELFDIPELDIKKNVSEKADRRFAAPDNERFIELLINCRDDADLDEYFYRRYNELTVKGD